MTSRLLISSLLVLLLFFPDPLSAFPILPHLQPSLPRIPRRPHLRLRETATHILATLSHPSLNATTTARVTLSLNPLTVRIDPLLTRPLRVTIPLTKTFTNVTIHARPGAVQLTLLKSAPYLPADVAACELRASCLRDLAIRVCQKPHLSYALTALPCSDRCAISVLERCQTTDLLVEGAAMLTQIVFAAVACVIVLTYGWGFAAAILSIPREVERLCEWGVETGRRIHGGAFKMRFVEILNNFVL